jgi:hypothetical protein
VKYIALLLLLVVSFAVASPALASFCRQSNDHTICILSIKRSAKYYWEYRAAVSIDGVKRPTEIYNCRVRAARTLRERVRVEKDGTVVRFKANDAGELICGLFQK